LALGEFYFFAGKLCLERRSLNMVIVERTEVVIQE